MSLSAPYAKDSVYPIFNSQSDFDLPRRLPKLFTNDRPVLTHLAANNDQTVGCSVAKPFLLGLVLQNTGF